jgi:hypothetical protein
MIQICSCNEKPSRHVLCAPHRPVRSHVRDGRRDHQPLPRGLVSLLVYSWFQPRIPAARRSDIDGVSSGPKPSMRSAQFYPAPRNVAQAVR